jgi:hypothetical protein
MSCCAIYILYIYFEFELDFKFKMYIGIGFYLCVIYMAYLKKTKRSKRKMRKTMRIRGGMFSGSPTEPVPGSEQVEGVKSAANAVSGAQNAGQAVPVSVPEAVTKEQAIECANKVVMFLNQ